LNIAISAMESMKIKPNAKNVTLKKKITTSILVKISEAASKFFSSINLPHITEPPAENINTIPLMIINNGHYKFTAANASAPT
jgi:hypothetical protein